MKKLLLLPFIFISCETPKQEEVCNCELALFENYAPAGCYFEVYNIPIDCQTNQPLSLPSQNCRFIKCLDE